MSKRRRNNSTNNTTNNQAAPKVSLEKEQSNQQASSNGSENTVWIANGAGNKPIQVDWETGDTVGRILERASITIPQGRTATLGQRRVRSMNTPVEAGETIVIAGMPQNG